MRQPKCDSLDPQSWIPPTNEAYQRTKLIDVRYHFVRQLQEDVIIDAIYVFSKEQKADLFTKPLPKPEFERMRKELGVDGIVFEKP